MNDDIKSKLIIPSSPEEITSKRLYAKTRFRLMLIS